MVVQGIRAADAEDLRWLRFRLLRTMLRRTSTYSVVTAALLLYFGVLGAFEVVEDDLTVFETVLSGLMLIVCLGIFSAVAFFGRELPSWGGLVLVGAHAAVSVYYLGFSDERQNAIAAFQELPIVAMYFSWFYDAKTARIGALAIVIAVNAAAVLGPFVAPGGMLGIVNIVSGLLFTWMCLEAGIFMRHRNRLEAHTDALTGALNRRGFTAKTQMEMRRAARHGRPLCLVVLDLDDFKQVNDGSGHAAGDDVLRSVSSQWMSLSRSADLVGRLGGDEFAMLLPETDLDGARELMQRLRGLASHPWSWGAAQLLPGDGFETLVHRADQAMYRDKSR